LQKGCRRKSRSRICLPTEHPLNLTGMQQSVVPKADVVLFLGVDDMWEVLYSTADTVTRPTRRIAKSDVKTIALSIDQYNARGNIADVKADHNKLRARSRQEAAFGWDASPVSVARLTAELAAALDGETWTVVVNSENFFNQWPQKLWSVSRWNQLQMDSGAGGLGFTLPSSIGAALALKDTATIPVAFQTDGDFMYVSSALWTAAHHHIPLLVVMHNNRADHAEHMNIQLMSNRRQRGITQTGLGTTLVDPAIDFGMLARSMGVWGMGPITDPQAVRPTLRQVLDSVKGGQPALVDVVTQPR